MISLLVIDLKLYNFVLSSVLFLCSKNFNVIATSTKWGNLYPSEASDLDEPTLSAVLFYHVVAETNQPSLTLSGGMVFSTVLNDASGQGELLFNYTDSGSGTLTDNNGRVTNIVAVDVQANNGIIHAIDAVLLP